MGKCNHRYAKLIDRQYGPLARAVQFGPPRYTYRDILTRLRRVNRARFGNGDVRHKRVRCNARAAGPNDAALTVVSALAGSVEALPPDWMANVS